MKSNRRTFLILAAGLAGTAARPSPAQDSFWTEIQLAVDTSQSMGATIRREDEQRLQAALQKRLRLFSEKGEGSVTLDGLSNIKLRVPVERVTPAQLKAIVRPMQLQVYHLADLRTGQNPNGRYELSSISVSGGREQQSLTRFYDLKERKSVTPPEFFKRCPLIVTNTDVQPNGATLVNGTGLMAVRVQFTDAGTRRLEGYLRKRGEVLGIVLDGEIISMSATTGDGRERKKRKGKEEEEEIPQLDIMGGFNTPEEANLLAALFNTGALPLRLKVLGTRLLGEKP